MTKKIFISTILLFIFSIVLVHNIIPHHHHDEVSEINNHEHNHHHDKKEKDHHNKNNEPIGLFSHPTHVLTSTEFTISSGKSFQKTQYVNQFFLIADLLIKPASIPIKQKPPTYIAAVPIQFFGSTHFLRGPPV